MNMRFEMKFKYTEQSLNENLCSFVQLTILFFSHWKELMNKTGQKFDINPETFTLANVFAMELHRFQETIGEIVTMASKEMGIEKVSFQSFCAYIELGCIFFPIKTDLIRERHMLERV